MWWRGGRVTGRWWSTGGGCGPDGVENWGPSFPHASGSVSG